MGTSTHRDGKRMSRKVVAEAIDDDGARGEARGTSSSSKNNSRVSETLMRFEREAARGPTVVALPVAHALDDVLAQIGGDLERGLDVLVDLLRRQRRRTRTRILCATPRRVGECTGGECGSGGDELVEEGARLLVRLCDGGGCGVSDG